ncbi:MAG: extracellular solute-binding protein [Caldilinea sp.]|nr:extracellular solute-binding protein [Caldilinea sp.]MDW8442049.1 substrate-binding domain-containing protein [Caldilineaceae bacterium]
MTERVRRQLRRTASLFVIITLLFGCSASPSPADDAAQQETISISGAFALLPMVSLWAEKYQALNPNVRFDIQGGGAGKGMTDVLSGAVDIAMLSREARAEEIARGATLVPVVIDAVVGVVNVDNPHLAEILAVGLTPERTRAIWVERTVTTYGQWLNNGSADPITVYTRADASGAGEMWARFAGGATQEELQGIGVNGDPGLAEAVRQDRLGVGYNNIAFAYDPTTGEPTPGLRVIPIDLNGDGAIRPDEDFYASKAAVVDAISRRVYPFPPARELYLVTKGEPGPTIRAFYRWILTDGQQYVTQAGYAPLTQEQIDAVLAKLR